VGDASEGQVTLDAATLTAFAVMVVGIAGNVVGVKYVLRDMQPMWAAASRFVIATAIFIVIARVSRSRFPQGRALAGAILYGVLTFGGFFIFAYLGLRDAPAGVAGVLLATVPILTFVLAIAHREEVFRWDGLLGALIVVAGTAVIFAGGLDEGIPVLALLAIIAAATCAAEGALVVKIFPRVEPSMRNAIGMGVGSLMLLVMVPVLGESPAAPSSTGAWLGQAYLIVFGSVAVFALYLFILGRWTASAVSYEFVLMPVVAILLAAWILDEPVTSTFAAGAALIIIGVYLGVVRPARARVPV
jgi:drug/metabolite transporter (DMT)-like permease